MGKKAPVPETAAIFWNELFAYFEEKRPLPRLLSISPSFSNNLIRAYKRITYANKLKKLLTVANDLFYFHTQ